MENLLKNKEDIIKNAMDLALNNPICKEDHAMNISEHLLALREYSSKSEHVTEFGTGWSCSTVALICGLPKKIISYDIEDKKIFDIIELAEKLNVEFIFKQQSSTKDLIENTDLLFIDSLHTNEHFLQELHMHNKNVNKYIICHDLYWPQNNLINAFNEFVSEESCLWKIEKIFPNNFGLGILVRK